MFPPIRAPYACRGSGSIQCEIPWPNESASKRYLDRFIRFFHSSPVYPGADLGVTKVTSHPPGAAALFHVIIMRVI